MIHGLLSRRSPADARILITEEGLPPLRKANKEAATGKATDKGFAVPHWKNRSTFSQSDSVRHNGTGGPFCSICWARP